MRHPHRVAAAALLALALSGCREVPPPDVEPTGPPARLAGSPSYDAGLAPAAAVLALVPASAVTLTVTDLDEIRAELGVPDLTSADLMTDRSAFWRRAEAEAPLLAAGMLREDNSELMLDYGFTEDDVDWEAHFAGPDGSGFVLGFRPDQDMGEVTRATRDGVGGLAGARVDAAEHLVLSGTTAHGADSWATDATLVDLVTERSDATYVRRGCVPLAEALGPEATQEDQAGVLAAHDVTALDPLDAFAVEFGDHLATVRMSPDRADLFERLHLADDWPQGRDGSGTPAFADGFASGVGDPASGRIGFDVPHPPVAVRLTLLETLPFGVCDEVVPIPEPTGL